MIMKQSYQAEAQSSNPNPSPELKANVLSLLYWIWLDPFIAAGNRSPCKTGDLYDLNPKEGLAHCEEQWVKVVNKESESKNPRKNGPLVWKLLVRSFGKELAACFVFKPMWFATLVVQVFLLKALVKITEQKGKHLSWLWALLLVLAMVLAPMGQSVCLHMLQTLSLKVAMKMRAIISLAVFDKMLAVNCVALAETSGGEMLNLLTNDSQKMLDAIQYFHFIWFSVVEMAVISLLCLLEIGISAVPGVLLIFLTQPLQLWMGRSVGGFRKKGVSFTDARVRFLGELLYGIRVVKYNGWIAPFLNKVDQLRISELRWIRKAAFLRSTTSTIKDSITPLASLLTFGCYSLLHKGDISPSKAFSILALYSILLRILNITPSAINSGAEALIGIQRLQRLLDLPNEDGSRKIEASLRRGPLVADDCAFSWTLSSRGSIERSCTGASLKRGIAVVDPTPGNETGQQPGVQGKNPHVLTLRNINLSIDQGEMVGIVGKVGSGKSSLLLALLGEMHCLGGSYSCTERTVAYVPQQPWIFNGTVRDNVLFGCEYDESRYNMVMHACALDPDIAILEAGHDTEIGERGINLSGGQRARISLARACYSPANIVLLDDPLSAVDTSTADHLMQHALRKHMAGRTILLVTHNKTVLQLCNRIYDMGGGTIRPAEFTSGTTDDQMSPQVSNLQIESSDQTKVFETENKASPESAQLTVEEDRQKGAIKGVNYMAYLQNGGVTFIVWVCVVFLAAQAARVMTDVWLGVWVDRKYNLASGTYLFSYAGFAIGSTLFSLFRGLIFTQAAIRSAEQMHRQMVERVFRSPQLFFDQNPVGRILNRLSKDQAVTDEFLPITLQQTVETLLGSVGALAVISALIPWFLLVLPPFFLAFIFFQRRYVKVSRELKRLDAISRSPIYEFFSQSLAGATSIRAFGKQEVARRQFVSLIEANQRAYMLFIHTSRWLGTRLDLLAAGCVGTTALLVVLLRHDLPAGIAGVVLVQSLQITGLLQFGVRQAAEVENYFTSVERIQAYCHLPGEGAPITPADGNLPEDWPRNGDLQVSNLTLSYREGLAPALNNLSFKLKAKTKLGILGRSGAGKSTVVAALFRMVENSACRGTIFMDGVDIKTLGLDLLRQRLSIVTQEPVLFCGSVRFNLDPFAKHSDPELHEALEKVHLKGKIPSLDILLESGGDNISVGERQLLCLARCLLRKSKIVVMDEPTAAVDGHTDRLIQSAVRSELGDCTLVTIAHRMETVVDCDLVLLLAPGGHIDELGAPLEFYKRAQEEDVTLSSLARAFVAIVAQTAEEATTVQATA